MEKNYVIPCSMNVKAQHVLIAKGSVIPFSMNFSVLNYLKLQSLIMANDYATPYSINYF